MSHENRTRPFRVTARAVTWNTDDGPTPAVRITGLRSTIYVGIDDIPYLERAIAHAWDRHDAIEAQRQQEVAA